MYISNPVQNDGVIKFISYTLGGNDVQNQATRRYSDFWALRAKLLERWPGVYIPNIPPKKVVGNLEKKNIDKRIRLLNKFCLKLSKYPFIYSSDEVILFQSHGPDVGKALEKSPKVKYPEMLEQYKSAFPNYDESYDLILGKSKMVEFSGFLKKTLKNLHAFHEVVSACVEKRSQEIVQYISLMHQMEEYEKYVLMEYSDNNESKLILFNPQNTALNEKVVAMQTSLRNPFVALEEWLEEEELDIEAGIEAMDSLVRLSSTVEKLNQKIESLENQLKKLQYGNQNPIAEFFKKKEEKMAELERNKTQTTEDLEALSLINKMAHFNMEVFFENFQKEKTKSYYKALKTYSLLHLENNKYNDDLWKEIKGSLNKVKEA